MKTSKVDKAALTNLAKRLSETQSSSYFQSSKGFKVLFSLLNVNP